MNVVEALLPCLKMKPKYFCQFSISKKYFILQNINQFKDILHIMKLLLVLMCYIKYLSGYLSYFDAGYFLFFSDMLPLLGSKGYCGFHSHSVFLEFAGKTDFCLPAAFGFLATFTRVGM
jgi:hypothetical protein